MKHIVDVANAIAIGTNIDSVTFEVKLKDDKVEEVKVRVSTPTASLVRIFTIDQITLFMGDSIISSIIEDSSQLP
jgi:hypothetical protein